jgi:hypothetical protein
VCSLKCCLLDVPGALAEEVAEVLLAYGAQSSAVEEFSPAGGAEQVRACVRVGGQAGDAGQNLSMAWHALGRLAPSLCFLPCIPTALLPCLPRRPSLPCPSAHPSALPVCFLPAPLPCPAPLPACSSARPAPAACPLLQEIFADEHASGRVWDRCTVVAWFPPEEDAAAVLASTATDFGLGQLQRSVEEVRTQDWEQSIRVSGWVGGRVGGWVGGGLALGVGVV